MTDKFRKGTNNNVLYVTSRCSNRCLMCCQPPKETDDEMYHYERNLALIESAEKETDYVCITGGEPTIIGHRLFEYMRRIWERMPDCCIHLLTNGRMFSDSAFINQFFLKATGKICIGIPLHSDNYLDHDSIAGKKGAFWETLKGLHNLGLLGFDVELRIIVLKQNYKRLDKIAEFITHNIPFVAQVSFMGLEVVGYAENNYSKIWIESDCYNEFLERAVAILSRSQIKVRIFNIPHCLLSPTLWTFSCKSISEWKKTNLEICQKCLLKDDCCGLFATSRYLSAHISPIIKREFDEIGQRLLIIK